jgi:hypothetical protein
MRAGRPRTSANPGGELRLVAMAAAACCSLGCDPAPPAASSGGGPSPTATTTLIEADEDERVADAGAQIRGRAEAADERIEVAAGPFTAGSTPGDQGRDPSTEPSLLEVELEAFSIDKLPYPNDPDEPPKTGVDRAAAEELCAERKGRLCTELEWERACKGPEGARYPGGASWEPSCASKPEVCASGFGALAMGAAIREWTASDVAPIKNLIKGGAAVRGASRAAAAVDHRCAHRSVVAPTASGDELGFRCCYGPANSAAIASPQWEDTIKRIDLSREQLAELLASNPRLESLAKDIVYFNESAASDTVIRRGKARGTDAGALPENTYLTTSPVLWNPVPGERILLVTGRSGDNRSFIVAFHEVPGGRYRVGSAMTMEDEVGPVVLVYNPFVRRKLQWTTCWECFGSTGNITYRDENRVVITQR